MAGAGGVGLTRRGVAVAAAGVLAAVAGVALRYPEGLLLGAVCLAAVGHAAARCRLRPALAVHRQVAPDRVERDAACEVTLTVRHAGRWRSAPLSASDRCGPAAVAVRLPALRPGGRAAVGYRVPTQQRGVVPVGPLRLRRRDALGLAAAEREHGGTALVRVYPRRHRLPSRPAGQRRSLDGRRDHAAHGTITFDTLRGYVAGDDLRRVHWRASARAGELLVREHLDTTLPHPVVLLDDRAAAYPDPADFETAVEAAASVAQAAAADGLPVTLLLVSGAVADGSRRPPAAAYLDLLTEAGLHADAPPPAALLSASGGDSLLFLTGAGGREALPAVVDAAGRFPHARFVVCARAGAPAAGPAEVVADGADFAARWAEVAR